jgi:geranylgeranyl diphosphate synthase type I
VAFQLRDDLIGAFGDPAETGKPFGSDVRSGKRTALAAEALGRLGPQDRHFLSDTLGQRDAADEQVKKVIDLYERSGSREAVEGRLAELVDRALAALDKASLPKRGASWLAGAATALSQRRR